MISFKNIQIKFGDFVAIKDLSLEVEKGEFFTFLGPSGCGKTTTLRSLAGFITPVKGTIEVKGEDITHKPIEDRGIGMVFQSYALFPTMTVRQNLEFGLKEHKWPSAKIAERVKTVAAMVNLTDEQLAKSVSELSGGQQQRVAIARALALDPEIILLDEPLSNLDAKLRKALRVELKRIQQRSGTTMIYVTHDQEEALTLSDHIAVFNNGYIEQVGTPFEIYNQPANEFVTTFVGDACVLNEAFQKQIEEENPSFHFEQGKRCYVRSEKVLSYVAASDREKYLSLHAILDFEEFYGNTTRRTYILGDGEIRSTEVKPNALVGIGDTTELFIAPEDLLCFEVL